MTDRVGDSTIDGVFDRDTGDLWFRKEYEDTGSDWWYRALLAPDGQRINGGTYAPDSGAAAQGNWTARR